MPEAPHQMAPCLIAVVRYGGTKQAQDLGAEWLRAQVALSGSVLLTILKHRDFAQD